MQKISPFLWFNDNAEQAAKFYVSVFKKGKIIRIGRYGKSGPGPEGSVMTVEFNLGRQTFAGLNGGPEHTFTQAISFVVHCGTQREVDYYWKKLSAGGKGIACGWLQDKFGMYWQIVPDVLLDLVTNKDRAKADRAMEAMMQMVKIDIKALKAAAARKK